MVTALITLQIFIVLTMILLVFMQKSSDSGLANLSSTGAGHKSVPSTPLGKFTLVLTVVFMCNGLALAKIDSNASNKSIVDGINVEEQQKPLSLQLQQPVTNDIVDTTDTNNNTSVQNNTVPLIKDEIEKKKENSKIQNKKVHDANSGRSNTK